MRSVCKRRICPPQKKICTNISRYFETPYVAIDRFMHDEQSQSHLFTINLFTIRGLIVDQTIYRQSKIHDIQLLLAHQDQIISLSFIL
jgi:hypothetical protein